MFLTGCATELPNEVRTTQQWPAEVKDKSYVIVEPMWPDTYSAPALLNYQNLLRAELTRLGFHEVENGTAALKITLSYSNGAMASHYVAGIPQSDNARTMSSRSGTPATGHSYTTGANGPFQPGATATPGNAKGYNRTATLRELEVTIRSAADGKQLFRANVHNSSGDEATDVLSSMLQSALAGFPAVNGTVRR